MRIRKLGKDGPEVSAIGLGCMGMSDVYGPADRTESIATVRAALDAGITLLDTGDFYGMGHNELLVREACGPARDEVFRTGQIRRAARTRRQLHRLRRPARRREDRLRLQPEAARHGPYRPLHAGPGRPGRADRGDGGRHPRLVQAGYVRHVGLSEAGPRRSGGPPGTPFAGLQIEYSLMCRGIEAGSSQPARAGHRRHRLWRAGARSPQRARRPPKDSRPRATFGPTRRAPRARRCAQNLLLVEALRKVAVGVSAPRRPRSRSPGRSAAATTSSRWSGPVVGIS